MAQVTRGEAEELTREHTHKMIRVVVLESVDAAVLEEFLRLAGRFLGPGVNVLEYTLDDEKLRMVLASLREAASSSLPAS